MAKNQAMATCGRGARPTPNSDSATTQGMAICRRLQAAGMMLVDNRIPAISEPAPEAANSGHAGHA